MLFMKSAQWDTVIDACNQNDPSMAYTLFIDKYKHLYDTAFPIVHCTTNKRHVYKQPWMSKALFKSCNVKDRLYLKYIKHPTHANRASFNSYRNKFKQIRRAAERTYYTDRIMNCENDLKKTWTVIKTLLSKNDISLAVDSFLIDNIEVTDKAVIANKFNKFFTEIGPTLAANIGECQTSFKNFLRDSPSSSIGIALTSPEEIMSIAKELRSTHSCGLDDISPQLARPTLDFVS